MKQLISPFHIRLPFTVPLVVRYVLITLLLTGFVLGCWSGITPVAHAASHATTSAKHVQHSTAASRRQRSRPSRANTSAIPRPSAPARSTGWVSCPSTPTSASV